MVEEEEGVGVGSVPALLPERGVWRMTGKVPAEAGIGPSSIFDREDGVRMLSSVDRVVKAGGTEFVLAYHVSLSVFVPPYDRPHRLQKDRADKVMRDTFDAWMLFWQYPMEAGKQVRHYFRWVE